MSVATNTSTMGRWMSPEDPTFLEYIDAQFRDRAGHHYTDCLPVTSSILAWYCATLIVE